MKTKIEENIASIENMKIERAALYKDSQSETISEAGRSIILKEIDAIQQDINMLAEQTAEMVSEYSREPQPKMKPLRLDGGIMTSNSAINY